MSTYTASHWLPHVLPGSQRAWLWACAVKPPPSLIRYKKTPSSATKYLQMGKALTAAAGLSLTLSRDIEFTLALLDLSGWWRLTLACLLAPTPPNVCKMWAGCDSD